MWKAVLGKCWAGLCSGGNQICYLNLGMMWDNSLCKYSYSMKFLIIFELLECGYDCFLKTPSSGIRNPGSLVKYVCDDICAK